MEICDFETIAQHQHLAIFFDDEPATIEDHMAIAEKRGAVPIRASNVVELYELMKLFGQRAIFFLDMHVPEEQDLSEIRCADISTDNGSAFGTAMYKAFQKTIQEPIPHANILSGRPIDETAEQVLSELEDHDFVVEDIFKGDKDKFDEQIKKYVADSTRIDPAHSEFVSDSDFALDRQRASAVCDILVELFDGEPASVAAAFGFRTIGADSVYEIMELVEANLRYGSSDIGMRRDFVIFIKGSLNRVFGEQNLDLQKAWLNSVNDFLGNRTPADMIGSADINDIALVAAALKRVAD